MIANPNVHAQEAKEHHFVPKLLLRPWLTEQNPGQINLCGYYWDKITDSLKVKRKGLKGFCAQLDLLSLKAHHLGRDAIERLFFGEVDTKGATALHTALDQGINKITQEQRCDFARLLLSLEARRPKMVEKLKDLESYLANELNNDPEIIETLEKEGITSSPADYAQNSLGLSLHDTALSGIQRLVDNPIIGQWLVNTHWDIVSIEPGAGTLVLADRPLIRINGFKNENAFWALPLTPKSAFICANSEKIMSGIKKLSGQRLVKELNVLSAQQAEMFVFSIDAMHEKWLGRYLRVTLDRKSCGQPETS